jgi:hypothetical protein
MLNESFCLNRREMRERERYERCDICRGRLCFTSLRNRRRWVASSLPLLGFQQI